MTHTPHTGSDFDDFLREEGLYEECNAIAIKRVLARQLAEEMKLKKIAKIERVVSIMKTVQTIKMCVKD
jgi:antitoxin HicB